ncbi:hypothetical protein [Streptomyces sp. DH18]|uniref:hypothetical protein n=1 Tax=Streptomyces sp. DH18 TaxID=3040126 RepID=UPI0024414F49|nr:hypothetical protein [Streptomyces sp. DH18]
MFIGKPLDHESADADEFCRSPIRRQNFDTASGGGRLRLWWAMKWREPRPSAGMEQVAVEGRCEAAAQGQADLLLPVLHQ